MTSTIGPGDSDVERRTAGDPGHLAPLLTTGQASALLARNRQQTDKVIRACMSRFQTIGRNRLVDRDDLLRLRDRPRLGLGRGEPLALAVHLGPLVSTTPEESDAGDTRPDRGFSATDDDWRKIWRWTRWWNIGPADTSYFTELNLPIIADVSGFVVHVARIVDWCPAPSGLGGVGFEVIEADEDIRTSFAGHQYLPERGKNWQVLGRP